MLPLDTFSSVILADFGDLFMPGQILLNCLVPPMTMCPERASISKQSFPVVTVLFGGEACPDPTDMIFASYAKVQEVRSSSVVIGWCSVVFQNVIHNFAFWQPWSTVHAKSNAGLPIYTCMQFCPLRHSCGGIRYAWT